MPGRGCRLRPARRYAIRCGVMKRWSGDKGARRGLSMAALIVVVLVGYGCGRPESSAPETPQAEVRGDPIAPASAVAVATGEESGATGVADPGTASGATPPPGVVADGEAVRPSLEASSPAESMEVAAVAVAVASPPATPEDNPPAGTPETPLSVSFEKLGAFQYDLPEGPVDTNTVAEAGAARQIPAAIKALNDQFISLRGFMLPLKVEKGLVTELLIMRDQSMCCYGTVPRINEWVSVKMVREGVKPIMDQAVTLFGRLKVGEMYENGYLVGIYAMDGDRMADPLDM